jgi:hypothetical protein
VGGVLLTAHKIEKPGKRYCDRAFLYSFHRKSVTYSKEENPDCDIVLLCILRDPDGIILSSSFGIFCISH